MKTRQKIKAQVQRRASVRLTMMSVPGKVAGTNWIPAISNAAPGGDTGDGGSDGHKYSGANGDGGGGGEGSGDKGDGGGGGEGSGARGEGGGGGGASGGVVVALVTTSIRLKCVRGE